MKISNNNNFFCITDTLIQKEKYVSVLKRINEKYEKISNAMIYSIVVIQLLVCARYLIWSSPFVATLLMVGVIGLALFSYLAYKIMENEQTIKKIEKMIEDLLINKHELE